MKKNIFKKFIVLFSLVFVSFGSSCVFAEDETLPTYLPQVEIHLEVISGSNSIYDNDIMVTPCDNEGDGVMKATPYCALEQSGIKSEWSGLWINSINGISNDYTNSKYWMWFSNLDFANFNLSSKQYELKSNDKILFFYDTNPLKISVDNDTPEVGTSLNVSIMELGYDSFWNPAWIPLKEGKISIGSNILI